jgi:CheY-like chemotaxis protein/HPt (histidine-containing phosphotransfer) domain-containing protein
MSGNDDRRTAFEARLAELKRKMEAGLVGRAKNLRDAVTQLLQGDEAARRVLKQEGHKLRGIAGSYGHQHLTELAAELEQRASVSPPPMLEKLANDLAAAAEEVGHRSAAAHTSGPAQTLSGNAAPSAVTAPQLATSTERASQPSRKRGASLRPQVHAEGGGALRVLAMDDDPTTLRLLRLTLKDIGGFDAVIVTSGQEALESMRAREFDVVISDAMMPDMNGKEFAQAARQLSDWTAHVPIIILSAATPDELGWKGTIDPSVQWLRKPFMPSTLVRDVARVVTEHREKRR